MRASPPGGRAAATVAIARRRHPDRSSCSANAGRSLLMFWLGAAVAQHASACSRLGVVARHRPMRSARTCCAPSSSSTSLSEWDLQATLAAEAAELRHLHPRHRQRRPSSRPATSGASCSALRRASRSTMAGAAAADPRRRPGGLRRPHWRRRSGRAATTSTSSSGCVLPDGQTRWIAAIGRVAFDAARPAAAHPRRLHRHHGAQARRSGRRCGCARTSPTSAGSR